MKLRYLVKLQGQNKFFNSLYDAKQYAAQYKYSRPQVSQWTQGEWRRI